MNEKQFLARTCIFLSFSLFPLDTRTRRSEIKCANCIRVKDVRSNPRITANIENSRQLRQVYLSEKGKIKERLVFARLLSFLLAFTNPKNGVNREKNGHLSPPKEREREM